MLASEAEDLDVALMQVSCIGCMICAKLAPTTFVPSDQTGLVDLADGRKIRPLVQVAKVRMDHSRVVIDCTRLCPTDSILVWNASGRLLNAKPLAPYIRPSRPYR